MCAGTVKAAQITRVIRLDQQILICYEGIGGRPLGLNIMLETFCRPLEKFIEYQLFSRSVQLLSPYNFIG